MTPRALSGYDSQVALQNDLHGADAAWGRGDLLTAALLLNRAKGDATMAGAPFLPAVGELGSAENQAARAVEGPASDVLPTAVETEGTTILYHRTGAYTAMEVVDNQAINIERLAAHQADKSFASGLYTTTQEGTANYYADLLFGRGQAGGPAILKIEVPTTVLEDFTAAKNISIEIPVLRMPGQTETFIPMQHLSPFNDLPGLRFSIHE